MQNLLRNRVRAIADNRMEKMGSNISTSPSIQRESCCNKLCRRSRSRRTSTMIFLANILLLLSTISMVTDAADDDYYAANQNNNNNNNNYYYNYYNDDGNGNDDGNNNANDDDAVNDDAQQNNDDGQGDDAAAANGDDYYAADDDDNDDYYSQNKGDDSYQKEQQQYRDADDDNFHWNSNIGFDGVSVMPLSCINYNSGHMIKFQLFDTANSYQCHFAEISTFVVSIAHYMRAYFNYRALTEGADFDLPEDAAYLNCVPLVVDNAYTPFYAKVGCMERETFTSTRLQIHVYTDQQCSQPYDDGNSARTHATKGYSIAGNWMSTKVTFKPDFYSCHTCAPNQIAETFNKMNSNWYDDDYISKNGGRQYNDDGNGNDGQQNDDQNAYDDQYYQAGDDNYQANNDDANNYNQDDQYNNYNYNNNYNNNNYNYNYNAAGDDYYGGRRVLSAVTATSREILESYHDRFWAEYHEVTRKLYDNDYYDIGDWNMCQRIYKYGVWCDEECRSLDFFRTDAWSASDVFLLVIMCTFLAAMILLIIAKRLKAQQKVRLYGEDQSLPGLPPCAMGIIFFVIMGVIVVLAVLKFINETLVFAVVTCILLFIYMLKLTLFENRRPVLLAAPRHDMFDNPLDDHLFD